MNVIYHASERRAEAILGNNATMHALNINRLRDGGLSTLVQVLSSEGVLGGGHLSLGDARAVRTLAYGLSRRNGLSAEEWAGEINRVLPRIGGGVSERAGAAHTPGRGFY
jgi:hypothetical protein